MSFPNKETRTKCYSSRDEFWRCLDDNLALNDDYNFEIEKCKKFRKQFIADCPSQWIGHFDRKYRFLKFKQQMDRGQDPIDEGFSSSKSSS